MANLKNKKSNAAKKTAATTTPVQASQTASSKAVEKKTPVKAEEKAVTATPEKEETVSAKIADKKTETEKTTTAAAKTAAVKKTAAKKPAAKRTTRKSTKKAEPIQEVFYEYAGEQILTEELVSRIKEQYKSEGHRIGAIKSLRVYINPEHRKAYYVINDKAEGSFIEF